MLNELAPKHFQLRTWTSSPAFSCYYEKLSGNNTCLTLWGSFTLSYGLRNMKQEVHFPAKKHWVQFCRLKKMKVNETTRLQLYSFVIIHNGNSLTWTASLSQLNEHEKKLDIPIQHSNLAQGDILITSGGSQLIFKHKTRATIPVFICKNIFGVRDDGSSEELWEKYCSLT